MAPIVKARAVICLKALNDLGRDFVAVAALRAFSVAGRCALEPIRRECRVVDELREERGREPWLEKVEEIALELAAFVCGDHHAGIRVLPSRKLHDIDKTFVLAKILGTYPCRLQYLRKVRAFPVKRPAKMRIPSLGVRCPHRLVGMRNEVVVVRQPRTMPEAP